jgi:orotate phosphoribosyltransferase
VTDDLRALLEERGGILQGHFLLTSGKHSGTYVQKARLLEDAKLVLRLGDEIAGWHPDLEVVVSPAVGAITLGFAVAAAAGARFLFAERDDGRMALRRGFTLSSGERALVVEDVITTGGSAREVLELVRGSGAEALGVAALVDRSAEAPAFPLRALLRVDADAFEPGDCPLCAAGEPLVSLGSRHL